LPASVLSGLEGDEKLASFGRTAPLTDEVAAKSLAKEYGADFIRLSEVTFFPQTIVHAFSTGEEAGKLGETLGRFAKGIEDDVDARIRKLVTKIEPLLVAILSFVVGFILLAIYLPIFDLMKLLHK
jgi:type II secretory pathway component PulF